MKSFLNFFSEARQTKASARARQLGLTGDGQGNWVDKAGNKVGKTEGGQFVYYDKSDPERGQPSGKTPQYKIPDQQVGKTSKSSDVESSRERGGSEEEGTGQSKEGQTLTLVFGRFNPPTIGHKKLLDSAAQVSGGGDMRVYPSRSNDPKKNPLEPGQKTELMRKMFPDHEESIINDESVRTIFDALKIADQDGYSNVKIVVGSDRVSEFDSLAQKYNGDLYDFEEIETISAGQRDDDSEGVTGMSASKMRKAAAEGDFKTFRSGIPDNIDDATAKTIMTTVRKAMNVEEGWSLWQIAPKFDWKNLRENYVKGNIFKINERVQNLNTGLVGRIVRRGTNYLICVTENDMMFKSWIRDLCEYTEVKMDRKMRTSKNPNTLSGTTGYFKYATDLTPGHEKGGDNLQPGGKAYKGPKSNIKEFINRYKRNRV
jgi:hypothetical protein